MSEQLPAMHYIALYANGVSEEDGGVWRIDLGDDSDFRWFMSDHRDLAVTIEACSFQRRRIYCTEAERSTKSEEEIEHWKLYAQAQSAAKDRAETFIRGRGLWEEFKKYGSGEVGDMTVGLRGQKEAT